VADDANFIFDLLSDTWEHYEDREQFLALWEGFLQIGSDLVLQLFQADLSKSIISIPVFRRYRWLHYDLVRTVVPSVFTCPHVFAFDANNEDILNIPFLSEQVREPEDLEYVFVGRSDQGMTLGGNTLDDVVNPFPAGLRLGDFVRMTDGVGLPDEDKDFRFPVERINSSTSIDLGGEDIADANNVDYTLERSPFLNLVEGESYVVSSGKLMFRSAPVLTPDDVATAFQAVEHYQYEGDVIRDNPQESFQSGTDGSVATGSGVFTSATATFVANGVQVGDYLVARVSLSTAAGQLAPAPIISKIISVLSETEVEVNDRSGLTTTTLKYDVFRTAMEDLELVSTENGDDDFPYAYAFQSSNPASPTGTVGDLQDQGDPDGHVLVDGTATFTQDVVGKQLRVFSGTGLDPAELSPFTIEAVKSGTELLLDRQLVNLSTLADAVYSIGAILEIDFLAPTASPAESMLPEQFDVLPTSSNDQLVTDGTIRFQDGITAVQPYIRRLRERRSLSPVNEQTPLNRLWAEETVVDQDQLFKNFGFPIQVSQENSTEYKNVLQGLWFAYWNGPTLDNIVRGLNLVFNLPFAPKDGVVSDISLPDPAFVEGTVESDFNVPVGTFDVSATNPGGDSRFLSFAVDNNPPILVVFTDPVPGPPGLDQLPAAGPGGVIDQINTAVGSPIASLVGNGRVRLSALTSVKIDTVIGNPGLGFLPGDEDFGTYNVTIRFDDGTVETLVFGTQFPLNVGVGERVDQFQPLTQAVIVEDYVSLPGWWDIFGITTLNSSVATFSQEDRDIINDILKDFTFAVRVVSDAFVRLGPVDREIVTFFLEQIKPTISDFLFIIAERFFDLISVTDDRNLLGMNPSPEFTQQHSGQSPAVRLDLSWKNKRNISWNFANYNQLTPAERAAFESTYDLVVTPPAVHMPHGVSTYGVFPNPIVDQYGGGPHDDFRLSTEDVTVVAPVKLTLIPGTGVNSYQRAEINGTVSSAIFTTVEPLVLRRQGFVPFIIQIVEWPAAAMRAMDVVNYINWRWSSLFFQERIAWLNPDGTLKLAMDFFGGPAPQLENLLVHAGFGLPVANVFGVGSPTGPTVIVEAS
jgi:hypothetical protein